MICFCLNKELRKGFEGCKRGVWVICKGRFIRVIVNYIIERFMRWVVWKDIVYIKKIVNWKLL